jgi:hypothetical protein
VPLPPARLRAARHTGDPHGFGLAFVDGARAAAATAVGDAWARLLGRDLPAAAERSLLRYFRIGLDLPVYALVAWVVYQVAHGFLTGAYAGVDFLLNAVLLLAAYLSVVRFAVRRGLAWRARRLLDEVILRARQALGAQADAARQSVGRAVAEQRAALERLAELEATWRVELQRLPRHRG